MTVEGMTIINTETGAVRSPVSGLTGGFSWFSLLLWGLDMVSRETHGSIQLPSDANKGVVSCNTGGSDETPTLVGTGVSHRQRSQGGAVLTITADRQKGSVMSRISQEEMGDRRGSERCARGDLASPSNERDRQRTEEDSWKMP